MVVVPILAVGTACVSFKYISVNISPCWLPLVVLGQRTQQTNCEIETATVSLWGKVVDGACVYV